MPTGGSWPRTAVLATLVAASGCECQLSRTTFAPSVCGNAVLEPGEQCDDGNRIDTDHCANDCGVIDCPLGTVFLDGACVVGCHRESDCGPCQRCQSGACVADPRQPACACTEDAHCGPCELCDAGTCVPAYGRPGCQCLSDDDCDPCESCERATCVTNLERPGCQCDRDRDCNNDLPCDGEERCLTGLCIPGIPVVCDASPCHEGICIAFNGHARCTTALALDGTVCAPDDACGEDYRCRSGQCYAEAVLLCETEPCHLTRCDPHLGCVSEPEPAGVPCVDHDPCTTGDVCDGAGTCSGTPRQCPEQDGNPCTLPACDDDLCTEYPVEGQPCDLDGDPCTAGWCVAGACIESPGCDDGIDCTEDTCDAATGACIHAPIQARCEDGEPCTHDRCDRYHGCTTVRDLNFTPCDDGDADTGPDFCYAERCVGGWLEEHDPGSSCPCSCSTWAARDCQHRAGEFLVLLNRHFDSDPGVPGCGGPVDTIWLYELSGRADLIATASTLGVGNLLDLGNVLGATTDDAALLGVLDLDNSVHWTGTPMHDALPQRAGPLHAIATDSFGRPSRHNVWLAGEENTTGRGFAVHCARQASGAVTCDRVFDEPGATVVGLAISARALPCPTPPCERVYDGALLAVNVAGGSQIFFDNGRDFSIETPGPAYDRPLRGAIARDGFGHEVFLYGDGRLIRCTKATTEEQWACEELALPIFLNAMHVYDATRTWDQELVFAVHVAAGDSLWLNSLAVLPGTADPHHLESWSSHRLPPGASLDDPPIVVRAVAGSRDTLYLVGDDTATGHIVVWSFGQ